MQVARTFGGNGLSKRGTALVAALLAAVALAIAGTYVAKSLELEAPHKAAAQATLQSVSGFSAYRPIRSGLQTGDGGPISTIVAYPAGAADPCDLVNNRRAC